MVRYPPSDDIFTMHNYRLYNPGGRVGWSYSQGKPYEWKLLRHIKDLRLKGVAFDIGAHVGNHTLWMAAWCGLTVHSWEPHQSTREALLRNLELNPGLNVTVHDWAAGKEDGVGRFSEEPWVSFDPYRNGALLNAGTGAIPIYSIDSRVQVDDLVLVKVDVEGMEPDALAGMAEHLKLWKPLVFAETHTDEAMNAIGEVIGPIGYRKVKTLQMGSRMDKWET